MQPGYQLSVAGAPCPPRAGVPRRPTLPIAIDHMANLAIRSTLLAGTLIALGACHRGVPELARDSPAGPCTVNEPGAAPSGGYAAYVEHVTPTIKGPDTPGSLGITVTCITLGTAPDNVVLMLPNLRAGASIPTGEYRVRNPVFDMTPAELTDTRLAWARVRRGAEYPLLYTADAGSVTITRAAGGVLEGAYHLALSTADSVVHLPRAAPEVVGPTAKDSSGARVIHRTVIGGAFQAPMKEASWRGQ